MRGRSLASRRTRAFKYGCVCTTSTSAIRSSPSRITSTVPPPGCESWRITAPVPIAYRSFAAGTSASGCACVTTATSPSSPAASIAAYAPGRLSVIGNAACGNNTIVRSGTIGSSMSGNKSVAMTGGGARFEPPRLRLVRTEDFARDAFEPCERRGEICHRRLVGVEHEHVARFAVPHVTARIEQEPVVGLAPVRDRQAVGDRVLAVRRGVLQPALRAERELGVVAVVVRAEELVSPQLHPVRDREERAIIVRERDAAGAPGGEERVAARGGPPLDPRPQLLQRRHHRAERAAGGGKIRNDVDPDRRDLGPRERR